MKYHEPYEQTKQKSQTQKTQTILEKVFVIDIYMKQKKERTKERKSKRMRNNWQLVALFLSDPRPN
jgi:hypothetical protein